MNSHLLILWAPEGDLDWTMDATLQLPPGADRPTRIELGYPTGVRAYRQDPADADRYIRLEEQR